MPLTLREALMTADAGLIGGRPAAFMQGQPVRSIGRFAYDSIAHGCAGRIVAVVSDAVYLQTHDGEILWLARAGVPMHRRGIICSYDENALRVGMEFQARAATLQIGQHVTIDLRGARLWQPRPVSASLAASSEAARARRSVVADALMQYATRGHNMTIAGRRFRESFATAVRSDSATIARLSRPLIGLGAGLTPQGDDLVGGLLFALHHLRQVYALRWDPRPVDDLLLWARTQTNIISHTILRDLAAGEGPEPLHDLVSALLMHDADGDVAQCVARLAHIGHSTGEAMLAGALTGLRLHAA
ncbi:MAG: DUF2877 domain-containing protein [Anaerolineae bacterium]